MTTATLSEPVVELASEPVAPVVATAPFTADDVAFCQERLASWHRTLALFPDKYPNGGNEHIWQGVLDRIAMHARGESAEFEYSLSSVAIDGPSAFEPRCRALLFHMLQVVIVSEEQAVIS